MIEILCKVLRQVSPLLIMFFPFLALGIVNVGHDWWTIRKSDMEKASFKMEYLKKYRTSFKTMKSYLKILKMLIRIENELHYGVLNGSDSTYAMIRRVTEQIEDLIEVIHPEHVELHATTLRNYPAAFHDVYISLIPYEDSLKVINDHFLSLIKKQMYTPGQSVEINEIATEYCELIRTMRTDALNQIKPYKEEKDEDFDTDIKTAKAIIEFEKELIQKNRVVSRGIWEQGKINLRKDAQ